jgi:hypothetical protein
MPTFCEPHTKIFKLLWRFVKWKHNKVHGEDAIVTSYKNRACKDNQIDFEKNFMKELII